MFIISCGPLYNLTRKGGRAVDGTGLENPHPDHIGIASSNLAPSVFPMLQFPRMSVSTAKETVFETNLSLPRVAKGKVRDIYAKGEDKLLIVTTDRLSAFDVVLPNPIPNKGKVLNQISLFWFERFQKLIPNHVITSNIFEMGVEDPSLDDRTILVKKAKPLPVECVVRGYIAGSGWKDYKKTGSVCGHKLPAGLRQCQQFPEPLFTPATKATVGHDENIDFDATVKLVGREIAEKIRDLSIRLFVEGGKWARDHGIIIADTKFEFGLVNGELILIDEVLTPDSSRFWPADKYEAGRDQASFDKQIVRNWLEESGWNKEPPPPTLPDEIVQKTSQAYQNIYEKLTGQKL